MAKTEHLITIENMQYSPNEITVHPGETVKWINKDLVPHTATATDHSFDSKTISPNASWIWRPKKAGSNKYKCDFHPTMSATLTVSRP